MAKIEILALHRHPFPGFGGLAVFLVERLGEGGSGAGERHAILRALGPGKRGHHLAKIERQRLGEHRVRGIAVAEQALRLGVSLDQRNAPALAPRCLQISERLLVDGEEAAGRAIFRRHIGDGGTVLERQIAEPDPEELHELADHARPPQHLGDGQHQIGRRDAVAKLTGEAEAHHLGDQHGNRLAEHGRLGLDAAHAPAEHREPVDHGGMAVGADQRIGEGHLRLPLLLLGPHGLRQIFKIDLVADAGAGRHHAEIVEGPRPPAQEGIALAVPLVFLLDIHLEGLVGAEGVDHHRMVDDEVDGSERIDLLGVAAERSNRVPHGGEIDHGGNAGEVLHQHPRRAEGDLAVALPLGEPERDPTNVVGGDGAAVLMAKKIFEEHL